jgi:hypothetical protein
MFLTTENVGTVWIDSAATIPAIVAASMRLFIYRFFAMKNRTAIRMMNMTGKE